MPRMTKEQLEQLRLEQERQTWVEFVKNYPYRFASVLYQTMRRNEFQVQSLGSGQYEISFNYITVTLPVVLGEEHNQETIWHLEQVEQELELIKLREEEQERQAQARRAALAKLSDEERRLLGL